MHLLKIRDTGHAGYVLDKHGRAVPDGGVSVGHICPYYARLIQDGTLIVAPIPITAPIAAVVTQKTDATK